MGSIAQVAQALQLREATKTRKLLAKAAAEAARQAQTIGVSRAPAATETSSLIMANEVMRTALERISFAEGQGDQIAMIARNALLRVQEINGR